MLVNPTRSYSAKDLPANTRIKYREPMRLTDFRSEVEQKEAQVLGKRTAPTTINELKLEVENPFTQDADLNFDDEEKSSQSNDNNDDQESGESEDEDASDDDLELLREYEKLKREREQEQRELELEKVREIEQAQ